MHCQSVKVWGHRKNSCYIAKLNSYSNHDIRATEEKNYVQWIVNLFKNVWTAYTTVIYTSHWDNLIPFSLLIFADIMLTWCTWPRLCLIRLLLINWCIANMGICCILMLAGLFDSGAQYNKAAMFSLLCPLNGKLKASRVHLWRINCSCKVKLSLR